ncbi:MAG: hypothetical protein KAR42_03895 [candidate division Zixibacteria bacterium]|nr:hypothetical protein [candidate division Zixibacteria bacterium]
MNDAGIIKQDNTPDDSLTVGYWLVEGWEAYKKYSCFWQVGLIYFLFSTVVQLSDPYIDSHYYHKILFPVTNIVLLPIIKVGVAYMAIRAIRGQGYGLADIGIAFNRFLKSWVTIAGLEVGAFIGGLFLIVPGAYFLSKFIMSLFVLHDKGLGVIDSYSYSSEIVKGYQWRVFGLLLIGLMPLATDIMFIALGVFYGNFYSIPLFIFTFLLFMFGQLVLGPVFLASLASAYDNLSKVYDKSLAPINSELQPPSPPPFAG